jgi:hypothetical protein
MDRRQRRERKRLAIEWLKSNFRPLLERMAKDLEAGVPQERLASDVRALIKELDGAGV